MDGRSSPVAKVPHRAKGFVRHLLQSTPPPVSSYEKVTNLHSAIDAGDVALVRQALQEVDANRKHRHDRTPLQQAAKAGNGEIVNILLEHGAQINAAHEVFGTALDVAALHNEREIVKLLVAHGADVNVEGGFRGSALQFAAGAVREDAETVQFLLEQGAHVNAGSGDDGDALQIAARCGYETSFRILLRYGANVHATNVGYDGSALAAAASCQRQDLVKLLIEAGVEVNAHSGGLYGNALQAAAVGGHEATIGLLLSSGANINAFEGEFGYALQAATYHYNQKAISVLLEAGAEINAQGGAYGNALHASLQEHDQQSLEIVKCLLDHGANATLQPLIGSRQSLLHLAVKTDKVEIFNELYFRGANEHIGSQNDEGSTPLHTAAAQGNLEMVQILLDGGSSPDAEDFSGKSPLRVAVVERNGKILRALFNKSTAGFAAISAETLRACSELNQRCMLEIVREPANNIIFHDEFSVSVSYPKAIIQESTMAPPTLNYIQQSQRQRKIFILPKDSNSFPNLQTEVAFHCRWWRVNTFSDGYQVILKGVAPKSDAIRQADVQKCFLDCGISLDCYVFARDDDADSEAFNEFEVSSKNYRREGISWIMMKSEEAKSNRDLQHTMLRSRIFVSTLEYAEVPQFAVDLLPRLVERVEQIWDENHALFRQRLSLMRRRILEEGGNDPGLIQELLLDAQVLETMRENLEDQISRLDTFRHCYEKESSRVIWEMPLDELKPRIKDFGEQVKRLKTDVEEQFTIIADLSQNMIQLEFNLTSISEAQKSTSTNRSLKRLTWITFIFLPLLFVASLFGMNVDVLKDNPSWWWYPVLAGSIMLITLGVWIIFKRNNTLEGSLERHFNFLFRSDSSQPGPRQARKVGGPFVPFLRPSRREVDLEKGSMTDTEMQRERTEQFPALGKKRS